MRLVSVVLLVATMLAGCSSSGAGGSAPTTDPTAWSKPLATTMCSEWLDVMSEAQRFAVAQEMIVALDAKDTSDTFARTFEQDVSKDCQAGPGLDLKLSEVAAALATLDTADFN